MVKCDNCGRQGKEAKITGKKLMLTTIKVKEMEWGFLNDYSRPIASKDINAKRDERLTDRAWKGAAEIVHEMARHGGGRVQRVWQKLRTQEVWCSKFKSFHPEPGRLNAEPSRYGLHHRVEGLEISGAQPGCFCFFYESQILDGSTEQSGAISVGGHLIGADNHGMGIL